MARKLIESPVTTRAARSALDVGVHWRGIDREIHLGYRKGRRGGRWIVRWYQSEAKTYQRIDLGDADDILSEGTLDYHAALRAAKDAVEAARRKATADAAGPILTVGLAVETYIAGRNARKCTLEGRDVKADADSTLKKHVLAQVNLCAKRLDELTEADLETWRLFSFDNSPIKMRNGTSGQSASGAPNAGYSRNVSTRKVLIGSGFTTAFGGYSDVALAMGWSRALTDVEKVAAAAWATTFAAINGVTV